MPATDAEHFLARTRTARKVMVLDLGFLGDTVHLLPALWMVRQAYPQAELHVTVAAHITSLMDCVPWVNRVWGYMRYPRHATLRENLQMVARLRREKFDVVINLNGSDRSSWLTFFSGARERLGRLPDDGGPPFWKRMFTAHVSHPFTGEPVYLQRCRCLEKAGFPFTRAGIPYANGPGAFARGGHFRRPTGDLFSPQPVHHRGVQGTAAGATGRIHRSRWAQRFPDKRLALSCAPTSARAGQTGPAAGAAAAKAVARVRRAT